MDRLLRPSDVARELGITIKYLRQLAIEGQIVPAVSNRQTRLYTPEEVQRVKKLRNDKKEEPNRRYVKWFDLDARRWYVLDTVENKITTTSYRSSQICGKVRDQVRAGTYTFELTWKDLP